LKTFAGTRRKLYFSINISYNKNGRITWFYTDIHMLLIAATAMLLIAATAF